MRKKSRLEQDFTGVNEFKDEGRIWTYLDFRLTGKLFAT